MTTTDTTDTTDRAALHALLRAQSAAWAAGDGAAFAATFTPDAVFVSVIGEHIEGSAELARVMQEGFDGFMRDTRLSEPERTTIGFPAPDVAVVVTSGVCVLRGGATTGDPADRSIQTRTAVRRDGRWLFASFQNTRIRQAP